MVSKHGKGATKIAHSQLVQDFQQSCAPRQRMLLSLLAICNKYDLNPALLVASFANDLPRRDVEVVDQLIQLVHVA